MTHCVSICFTLHIPRARLEPLHMKMAAALPAEETKKNGMGQVRDLLIQYPDRPIVVVAILDCAQVLTDNRKHTKVPTAGILHIEPMVDQMDHLSAERLLRRAYLARTKEQLELELDFNIPPSRDPFPTPRWRGIDPQGNVAAQATPEPPDDPDEGETGPAEVDLDNDTRTDFDRLPFSEND